VYRVSLDTGAKVQVVAVNQQSQDGKGIVGNPRLMTVGGGDVLILDDFNSLWRWHPAPGDNTGRGSLLKVAIPDNATWGVGARAMGTFMVDPDKNEYDFCIVVPSQQQVLKYSPAADLSGYPTAGRVKYLSVAQDVSAVDDMYVDGNVYLLDKGKITRYDLGQAVQGWSPSLPPGTKSPFYIRLTADNSAQDTGVFYAFDGPGRRIVAFKKIDGAFVGQYAVASSTGLLSALTGMFVVGTGANAVLYWTESGSLRSAALLS
jgi:hypothetical protein